MILVDTSVWVDHLRDGDPVLTGLLDQGLVLIHPFVIGELALGTLQPRDRILDALSRLPRTALATDSEVLHSIERHALHGRGIGYVDVHLLVAVRLTNEAILWTRDKRLQVVAEFLGLAMGNPPPSAS